MIECVVEEVDGEFVLPLAGFVCSEARRGDELVLRSADSTHEAWVSGSHVGEDLIRGLVRREARVEGAVATRDSTLRIDFDEGISLENPPAEGVEAWEVRGPGYVLVVAMPGGGDPAIWDETSEIRAIHAGDRLPADVVEMVEAYGLPMPTGEFEFRRTTGRRRAVELHPPNAPRVNRSEIVRVVLPGERSSNTPAPWWRKKRKDR